MRAWRSEEDLSKLGPTFWLMRHQSELERGSTSPGPEEAEGFSFPGAARKPCAGWLAPALDEECLGHLLKAHLVGKRIKNT